MAYVKMKAQPKQRLRLNLRLLCKQGVTGSIPVTPTNLISGRLIIYVRILTGAD